MNKKFGLKLASFFILLSIFSCNSKKRQAVALFKGDLFDATHLHEVRIYFDTAEYWDSLVWFKKQKDSLEVNHYLKCDINIDGTELSTIGIRLKGESSYDFTKGKKKSFKLDLNSFIRKQKYKGVSRINLNNNYKDPTFMREKLALDLMQMQNLPAPQSAYTKVYLNDEYWGVYLLVEEVNKDFLKRNFGSAKGNLYFGEPNGTLEKKKSTSDYFRFYRKKNNKKANNWTDLEMLINAINSNGNEKNQETELDSLFNVDACLKTWAINNLLLNVDAYNMLYPHNYFLYNDSTKMQWINYDYNFSFAAWNPKFTYKEACELSIFYCNESLPLANTILNKNSLLKTRYFEILKQLVATNFDENEMATKIKTYHILIKDAVKADTRKEYSYEEFEKNIESTLGDKNDPGAYIPGLKEFLHDRKAAVVKQISIHNKSIN